MEYKELERVNKDLKGINVKGKNYIEVNTRIQAFRKLYPEGIIETEMISNENGVCVFKAKIFGEHLLATGHAYEKENSTFINKTSYIENCETSAIGRALGMLGIGIDTSIASAEEVQNAINNQTASNLISTDDLMIVNDLIMEYDKDLESILKYFKIKSTSEMTKKQFEEFKKIVMKGEK